MPEKDGYVDKRRVETEFSHATERQKGIVVAKESKALRMNRRQMFKNAALEDKYEPEVTTKQVPNPLAPEIDLPALK